MHKRDPLARLPTRVPRGPALGAVALALAGCATSALDLAPSQPDRPWQPPTSATGEIVAGAASRPAPPDRPSDYTLPANSALATIAPPAQLDATHPYSLAELIDLAESSNPLTRVAWNDARNAALATGIARSTYLPQISVAAMGGWQNGRLSSNTALGTAGVDASHHGAISVVSLQWLLFDFGERAGLVEAAEQATVAANIAFTAMHQRIIHDVSVAYYRYQAARSRRATVDQAMANAEAVLTAAKARYARGVGTVVEVAQATQNRAQTNLAMVQAQGAETDAYLGLVTAIGISPLSKPRIAEMPLRQLSPALRSSVEQIVERAIAQRPDVLGAYALERANQARVKAAEAAFLPKVFMSAFASYASGGSAITAIPPVGQQPPTVNLNGYRYGNSVFLGVTLPIYDGGMRSAVLAQARNDVDSASAKLTRAKEESVRQVVVSQSALESSLAAYDAARALADAAQITYDAAFAAYRKGVGTVTEANLAQNQLLLARNASADAYSAALAAAATLALAAGDIGRTP
ncbi:MULTISPECIES: TolC family protein [unclassified Cupriavidus]|uniref:TolC family protein n=1 Tax=unclassified Cupriavidus TaxID=2640874 RepID=UPI001BFFE6F2|nr:MULTISPECIES: TolC family protein [unclassified Cupriavidus]MCA3187606.1 TolC family protein [Cupriavidus sp.]MCA3191924.1 TolC family protein [Cupriavidus sp.]MCA3197669.1 TolC family protein [Cupriavidus sp.]MCA3202721.1 TolC family protein [Cupriavidus sp.]MCA3209087.1 TolC family protein [Cupriavidus sp.]